MTRRLVNGGSIKVPVKKNKQDSIELLFYVDGAHALAGLTAFEHTPTFDLKPHGLTITSFDCVIASLSRGRELNAKNASSFIFGNLPSDAQWLASKGTVSFSEFLRLSQYFEYRISAH